MKGGNGDKTASRRVFEEGFTAGDIARPLLSFDDVTPADHAAAAMQARRAAVAGVRTQGFVTGTVEFAACRGSRRPCGQLAQPLDPALLVADALPLGELVVRLKEHPRLFVLHLGQATGLVERFDLEREPGRMWLFGMVTLLEMRFGRLIAAVCPDDSWRQFLSPGRLQKAHDVLGDRRRRNPAIGLIDCLQFADKITIMARHDPLRELTRFESRAEVQEIGKELERLRNNLAHGQPFVTENWETVAALASNLAAILAGPPESGSH